MKFSEPEVFDDPQVFEYPKVISTGSMDFDIPKVFGETSIFDSLVDRVEPPAFDT